MFFHTDINGTPAPSAPQAAGAVVWTRNKFLTGLAVATPLIITFWILQFVYYKLHDWNEAMLIFVADQVNLAAGHIVVDTASEGFKHFNTFVGVLIPLLVLIALGTLASNVIGRQVVDAVDKLVLRLPFISAIYKTLKQVIESFKNFGGSKGFKRVVYIDYPAPGMWMMGFVTGQFHDRKRDKAMSLVFVPGALSPMTGLLLAVETERLSDAPVTMEEAMKLVFSGGLVTPDSQRTPKPGAAQPPLTTPPSRTDLPPGLPVADADEMPVPAPVPVLATAKTAAAAPVQAQPEGKPVPAAAATPAAAPGTATAPVPPATWRRALAAIRGTHETV